MEDESVVDYDSELDALRVEREEYEELYESTLESVRAEREATQAEWRRVVPWYLRWMMKPERPMYLIVGRRGSGKTLLAAEIAQARMKRGERVYANFDVELVKRVRGGFVPVARAGRIYSLLDALDLGDCSVVIDEANLWVSARQWSKIPASVLSTWQQSRKRGLSFVFTSQHEERVDKIVRELTDWILVCERPGILPKWLPFFRVKWTYLEEIGAVRRGADCGVEYRWVPDRVFAGYDTCEELDPEQLESIHAYLEAVKRGEDPDELGIALPARREPVWIDAATGETTPWDSTPLTAPGTASSSEAEGRNDLGVRGCHSACNSTADGVDLDLPAEEVSTPLSTTD